MWLKLTNSNGKFIYVNMDRFDMMETVGDPDLLLTRISSTLSEHDEDMAIIDVHESPEKIMMMMVGKR